MTEDRGSAEPRRRKPRDRPLVIVITGTGKGKSTSSFGMLMRAWARGYRCGVFQFVKSGKWKVGEAKAAAALGGIDWEKMGDGWSWLSKDLDESAAAFQRAVHLSPQTPRMHGALGRTFALSGRRKQALEVLRKLEAYAKERYVSPLEFAWIQFALGDVDLGFRWMTKACEDRVFDLISIKVDPRFDSLRGDRRFAAIARQLGVP